MNLFERFNGLDAGLDPTSISPNHSPDLRNWVSDDFGTHGPRRSSKPFKNYGLSYPVRHMHTWMTRGGNPAMIAFADDDTNMQATLDFADWSEDEYFTNIASDWWLYSYDPIAMTAGTRYYVNGFSGGGVYRTSKVLGTGFPSLSSDWTKFKYMDKAVRPTIYVPYKYAGTGTVKFGLEFDDYDLELFSFEVNGTDVYFYSEMELKVVDFPSTPNSGNVFLYHEADVDLQSGGLASQRVIRLTANYSSDFYLVGLY